MTPYEIAAENIFKFPILQIKSQVPQNASKLPDANDAF
jgi:hypothetical protein